MTFITSPEHFLKVDYLMAFLTPLVQLYQDAKFHKSANYSEQQLAISTVLKVVSFRLRFWLSVSLFPAAESREHWGSVTQDLRRGGRPTSHPRVQHQKEGFLQSLPHHHGRLLRVVQEVRGRLRRAFKDRRGRMGRSAS